MSLISLNKSIDLSTLPILAAPPPAPSSGIKPFNMLHMGEPWLHTIEAPINPLLPPQVRRVPRHWPREAFVRLDGANQLRQYGLPTFNEFSSSAATIQPTNPPTSWVNALGRRTLTRAAGNTTLAGGWGEANGGGSWWRGNAPGRGGFLLEFLGGWTQRSTLLQWGFMGIGQNFEAGPFTDPAASPNTIGLAFTSVTGSLANPTLAPTPLTDLELICVENGSAAANRTRIVFPGAFALGDAYYLGLYGAPFSNHIWALAIRFSGTSFAAPTELFNGPLTLTLPLNTAMMGMQHFANHGTSNAAAEALAIRAWGGSLN